MILIRLWGLAMCSNNILHFAFMAGEAGMRQRKGGANGAGGAAPGAPGPAVGQPQMVNKGFKFGFCQSLSVCARALPGPHFGCACRC